MDRRIEVLDDIIRDSEDDVHRFERQPFTGPVVSQYLGNQAAMLQALAKVLRTIVEEHGVMVVDMGQRITDAIDEDPEEVVKLRHSIAEADAGQTVSREQALGEIVAAVPLTPDSLAKAFQDVQQAAERTAPVVDDLFLRVRDTAREAYRNWAYAREDHNELWDNTDRGIDITLDAIWPMIQEAYAQPLPPGPVADQVDAFLDNPETGVLGGRPERKQG